MTDQIKAGGIIFNNQGQVAVVTNHLGRLTFPKGSVEAGETLLDTAKREIQEETGLTDFEIGPEIGIIIRPGYTAENTTEISVTKHIHIYACQTSQLHLKPQQADIVKAEWVDRDQVKAVLSWPQEAEFFINNLGSIDAYLAGR